MPSIEPADRVSHHFLCDRILLVRFLVHEHERRFVAIQELGFPFADVGGFQSVAALVGSVDDGILQQVSQPAFVQRLPLPG